MSEVCHVPGCERAGNQKEGWGFCTAHWIALSPSWRLRVSSPVRESREDVVAGAVRALAARRPTKAKLLKSRKGKGSHV